MSVVCKFRTCLKLALLFQLFRNCIFIYLMQLQLTTTCMMKSCDYNEKVHFKRPFINDVTPFDLESTVLKLTLKHKILTEEKWAKNITMILTSFEYLYLLSSQSIFARLDLRRIVDPVAFIRKGSQTDGFSRVVVFTEEQAGHFKSNDLFHAVQVGSGVDGKPYIFLEAI
jgi:hypothetical protein